MPLPLLFIIPTAAVALKANADKADTIDTNAQANAILKNAKQDFEARENACSKELSNLGSKKVFVLETSIDKFIITVERLKNVDLRTTANLSEVGKFSMNQNSLIELKEMKDKLSTTVVGTALSVTGGTLLSLGAFGELGSFIAGRTLLGLGNIVLLAKANSQKNKAYANLAEAKRAAEELENAGLLCDGIRRRSNMFYNLLVRLDALFTPLVMQTGVAVREHNGDYQRFSQDQKHTVGATFALAGTIKAVLDTPILSESGELTEESANLIPQANEQIKASRRTLLPAPQRRIAQSTQRAQCPNCNSVLPAGTKFCTHCGTKL